MGLIKKAWVRFDWELFKAMTFFAEEELMAMPPRIFQFERRVYDLTMLFAMFGAMGYGAARIYESMSLAAIGHIPPNFVQLSPLVCMALTTCFLYYAGSIKERLLNEHNPRKGN